MGSKASSHIKLKARRESVVQILTNQLALGTKPVRGSATQRVPMTDADVARIGKQIAILDGPIMKYRRKNRKYNKDGTSKVS